jgi:hypothetical protein
VTKRAIPGVYSLAVNSPEVVAEWDSTRNLPLTPDTVTPSTHQEVWWQCSQGHQWEDSVNHRSSGRGCPYCSKRRVLSGENDLATVYPALSAEWLGEKNAPLTPETISPFSSRHVWWQCSQGHEWQANVASRSAGNGCPYCSGRRAVPGKTDLATLYPELAAQWHPSKNEVPVPDHVRPGTHAKVWWQCSQGHEWQAVVKSRVAGNGCPMCGGWMATPGETDLASQRPELLMEWHPTKNGDIDPTRVSTFSNKPVWWQCRLGHEWKVPPSQRSIGQGCPTCSGRRVLAGFNDLTTKNFELAAQWDLAKNGDLLPEQVAQFSNRRVWWLCSLGHSWRTSVAHRSSGKGCPYCAFQTVLPGFNDLATTHPDLAAEWHPTRNGDVQPSGVLSGTHRKASWRCSVEPSHVWRADIHSRAGQGIGCPSCARSGFDPGKDGWLYLLADDNRGLMQIGISNVPAKRLATHQRSGWRMVDLRGPMSGDLARKWETDLLAALRSRGAVRPSQVGLEAFDGHTESWVRSSFPIGSINELMGLVHSGEEEEASSAAQ